MVTHHALSKEVVKLSIPQRGRCLATFSSLWKEISVHRIGSNENITSDKCVHGRCIFILIGSDMCMTPDELHKLSQKIQCLCVKVK
jgi:hypothetical protein